MAPMYACDRRNAVNGEPCNFTSKRKFNLDRHIDHKHKEKNDGFIQYVVGGDGKLGKKTATITGNLRPSHLRGEAPPPSSEHGLDLHPFNPIFSLNSNPHSLSVLDQGQVTTQHPSYNTSLETSLPVATANLRRDQSICVTNAVPSDAITNASLPPLQPPHILKTSATAAARVDATNASVHFATTNQHAVANANVLQSLHSVTANTTICVANHGPPPEAADTVANHNPPLENADPVTNFNDSTQSPVDKATNSAPIAPWQERKERNRKRLLESVEKEALPEYRVKRSKKWPSQQRAVDWMTQAAKQHFDNQFSTVLAQWGVKETHKGTCVLLPSDWAALDPLKLAALFSAENCPLAWADGVAYKYADHTTTLTRAVAWFADGNWPRNGAELDNFLGCGPYKPKQGSHLCHHHLCGIHLILEDPETNEDRKNCHRGAKFLRQENLPIPEHCTRHNPPCLMQHAALTTLESFWIQFFVLFTAKGIALPHPPPRPRWHPYSTWEYQLPLRFCRVSSGVNLTSEETVSEVMPPKHIGKPDLKCRFCSRIKAFKSIIALWSHLLHQHYKSTNEQTWLKVLIADQDLLEEIRRTASLWRIYWREHSDGGKRRDPTMMKLNQVAQDDFCMNTVLDWQLR